MKNKNTIIALIVLAALVVGALACWLVFKPKPQQGSKNIVIEVIHKDGTKKEFQITTDAEYLYDAMKQEKIVGEMDNGYISQVNGETADANAEEWWRFSDSGDDLPCGAGEYPICDGGHYEVTFTVGW